MSKESLAVAGMAEELIATRHVLMEWAKRNGVPYAEVFAEIQRMADEQRARREALRAEPTIQGGGNVMWTPRGGR